MAGRLKLIAPPAAEPVSASDMKSAFTRISADVPDADLNVLIKTARQLAEGYLNRALITQTWDLVFDHFPIMPLDMPNPPLASLTSVTILDISGASTTMNTTDFAVDLSGGKGRLALKNGKSWPSVVPETAGVVIRYVCGYGNAGAAVPDQINTAIKIGALWLYDHPGEDMAAAFYTLLEPERVVPV